MAKDRKEYMRAWRAANRDYVNERARAWKRTEKGKAAARRRAVKQKAYMAEYRKQYYAKHRDAILADHKERYYRDPQARNAKYQEYRRRHNLKQYGLTPEQYDAMLERQRGVCAICHHPPRLRAGKPLRLAVDHVDGTTTVRGLLCSPCNRGIGCLRHDPALLERAVQYLQRTS